MVLKNILKLNKNTILKNILKLNKNTILLKLGLKKKENKNSGHTNDYMDDYLFTNKIKKGDKVVLVPNYQTFSDSSEGPLKPNDVGIVVENDNSYKPFKVEFNNKTWWYDEKSVKKL